MMQFGIYVLSEDPPIFCIADNFVPTLVPMVPPGLEPHLLVFPMWTKQPATVLARTRWRLRHVPSRRITWMCNTYREVRPLGLAGYQAMWCHHNIFIDEDKFYVDPVEKKTDAVYNAVFSAWKRTILAKDIASLRLITGRCDRLGALAGMGLGHAVTNPNQMNREEVNRALNESRVGLALSAAEGGMIALTEYLLCGLPVVSTPSIGGRDVWLDESNSKIVPADSASVAAGVRYFVENPHDPHAIRADALRRMRFFRTTLAETVRRDTNRMPFDPDAIDGKWLSDRFVPGQLLPEYLASYANGHFARADLLGLPA